MTNMTAIFSQISGMENVKIAFVELNANSQQVKHAILQTIISQFNKKAAILEYQGIPKTLYNKMINLRISPYKCV